VIELGSQDPVDKPQGFRIPKMQKQKVLGYMLTWTAYGNWLQGDKRKYVKNGQILDPNPSLESKNKENMKYPKVSLTAAQRKIIERAIIEESAESNQKIYVIAIRKSHIHLVADCNFISAASAVSHYKNAARLAMESNGFVGRLWTRGFSVRYCFDENQLNTVIEYVSRHIRRP
jgi:REP element-mobilizing transposase RayT